MKLLIILVLFDHLIIAFHLAFCHTPIEFHVPKPNAEDALINFQMRFLIPMGHLFSLNFYVSIQDYFQLFTFPYSRCLIFKKF